MHGPLLGWAKLKGHEIYWETRDGCEFAMARVSGVPFDHYPFKEHGADAIVAIKKLLVRAKFWHGAVNRLPQCATLPSRNTWETNNYTLKKEFGSAWNPEGAESQGPGVSSVSGGLLVLQSAPEGVELLIKDPNMFSNVLGFEIQTYVIILQLGKSKHVYF